MFRFTVVAGKSAIGADGSRLVYHVYRQLPAITGKKVLAWSLLWKKYE